MRRDDLLLYAVTDRRWLHGKRLYDAAESALQGGVTFLQLREKSAGTMPRASLLEEARAPRLLCRRYRVPFVIDDDVELAMAIGADGVHVGQSDMEAGTARRRIGKDKILGVSVQTVKEARIAAECGADYLGVGAVFPTNSKEDAEIVRYETLKEICSAAAVPVVAIGGIDIDNIGTLVGRHLAGVAVISALFGTRDVKKSAENLRNMADKLQYEKARPGI